jgi:hypothetical protein
MRANQVVWVKVGHIDGTRMVIRVEQGETGKARPPYRARFFKDRALF